MMRLARRLRRDQRGGPALEFALIAPAMLMLCMGLGELAYQGYVQAVLTGAVQKAGRDATIQGWATQTGTLDQVIKNQITSIAPDAVFNSVRNNYDNYGAIAGEPFTDSKYPANSSGVYDGICDHGESYTDVNGNGKYDSDLSQDGEGGANDISKYTMTVTYPRIFPVGFWLGWGSTISLSATTLLKNQPYATQNANTGTTSGTCP